MTKDHEPPHAKAPTYVDHSYIWTDVEVLDFNPSNNKFKVRVIGTNQIKEVYKLSLIFKFENDQIFTDRLQMAKNLFQDALDDQRYLAYIQQKPDSEVSSISQNQI